MKKSLFIAIALFAAFASNAQFTTQSPVAMTNSLDTIVNTTAQNSSATVTENLQWVAIQGIATKSTGTMGGKMELQGSIDGTNWKRIATDTLAMTTASTAQSYIWVVTNPCYYKYRVLFTPTGTMSAHISAYILKRRAKD